MGECLSDNSTCTNELGECANELDECKGDNSTCNNELDECLSDNSTCNTDLDECKSDNSTYYIKWLECESSDHYCNETYYKNQSIICNELLDACLETNNTLQDELDECTSMLANATDNYIYEFLTSFCNHTTNATVCIEWIILHHSALDIVDYIMVDWFVRWGWIIFVLIGVIILGFIVFGIITCWCWGIGFMHTRRHKKYIEEKEEREKNKSNEQELNLSSKYKILE